MKYKLFYLRRAELANVEAFKYRFIGLRKKCKLLKWQCTKNDSKAKIY